VMHSHREGDLELGADTIGTRNKHRGGNSGGVEAEETAEAANLAQHLLAKGPLREVLDSLFGAVATGNVDSGIGIRDRAGFWFFGWFRAAGSFREWNAVSLP
jgi:hypothetical protein